MSYKPTPTKTEGGQKKTWVSDDNTKEGLELLLEELRRLNETDIFRVSLGTDPLLVTTEEKSSTANIPASRVTVTSASTTIIAANTSRKSFILFNLGTEKVYFRLGSPAVTTDFELAPNEGMEGDDYLGIITGITSSGTSTVEVIEI